MAEDNIQKQEELLADENYREMIEAWVFYGRKKSKTHPRMKVNVLGNRNGIEIINLLKTRESLDNALAFLKSKLMDGKTVLFVATQPPASDVKELAAEFGYPAVISRWLGGTLTNNKVIMGRIEYYRKLKSDFEKGALDKYTKKERLGIEREIGRMSEIFSGLDTFQGLPDIILAIDSKLHQIAVRESKHVKVPVIAFVNTDANPDEVEYPVYGNNKAKISINWFLGKVREVLAETKAARAQAAAEKKAAAEQAAK